MSNVLNKISQVYLDQVLNVKKAENEQDLDRWTQTEAKYEAGASTYGKATIRNKRKFGKAGDLPDVMTGKKINPTDETRGELILKRREEHKTSRGVKKESFSNWRNDLVEVMDTPMTEPEAEKKVDIKKGIKNKVTINPKLTETIKNMGGELLEVKKIEEGDGDPCWDSHKQVGMKKKGNKMVPNCVPKNEETVYTGPNKEDRKQIKKMDNPSYAKKLADYEKNMDPKKRQALKDKATKGMKFTKEETLDEKCWKGYKKKGMKTMFGKRYPNCVKKEEVQLEDMGKISHTKTKKDGKTIINVNPNDESDAQKAMKNDPKYILGKTRVQPTKEEIEFEEGVKGADPEMRKMAAADRKQGKDKLLSKKAGDRNVANMTRKIEQGREMGMAKAYEEVEMTRKAYKKLHKDFKSDDPKNPRTTKYNPKTGGTESHPVKFVDESDKKGKGSGKKDACYHKVKASASVWPSAYASGRLVQCRKKGAANYGNSKKEDFSDWKAEFIWEDGDSAKKITEDDMKGMSVGSGHKRPTKSGAGMTQKGVEAYRRKNPGSKLQTAVTGKVKKGSKDANRRKSYCARSAGQMKKFPKAAKDPDSRLRQARRRWKC